MRGLLYFNEEYYRTGDEREQYAGQAEIIIAKQAQRSHRRN